MADRVSAAATLSYAVLALVVAGVGGVAVVAEWRGDWESYFIMERVIEVFAPAVTVIAMVALLAGFVVVYRAS